MFKKTITWTDYNGKERTEDFYFNLSKSEIARMELVKEGGIKAYFKKIIDKQDPEEVISAFEELIFMSYGERENDGIHFTKVRNGVKLAEAFTQTEAYSELFMEFITNAEKASEFVNGITPK